MKKYESLKNLFDDVKKGKIDETKLTVILDNDCTNIYLDDGSENGFEIFEGNGYFDIEILYPILFPKSNVEWC